MERTDDINRASFDFSGPLHWFPAATDPFELIGPLDWFPVAANQTVELSRKEDRGL